MSAAACSRARRRLSGHLVLALVAWLLSPPAPEARAIVSSTTSLNINQFLGAERFYNGGYTGTRAIQANIEAAHVWNAHRTLRHVTTRITGNGALGTDRSHPTQVGFAMGGHYTLPGDYFANPSRWGMAFDAEMWSGAIATSFGSGDTFNFTESSIATVYAPILQTGSQTGGATADVFNSSWGNDDHVGTELWTRAIDGLINANGTVGVIAAGNYGPAANSVGGVGAGYNSITVAALGTDEGPNPYSVVSSFSSRGPNDFAKAVGPTSYTTISTARAVVDIAAPGQNLTLATKAAQNSMQNNLTGTSFAAPLVAGGASLIVDAGKDLYTANASAIDGRVVKSVLLNSADKIPGWNNGQVDLGGVIRTTRSLDWTSGAGRMNLDRAFDQYVSGQNGGMAGTVDLGGMAPDDIAPIGWDFGSVDTLGTNTYFIDQQLTSGTDFTTTLTWFADRSTGSLSNFNGAAEEHLANLDLRVVRFDDPINRNVIETVAESISLYNVVEHLSFITPLSGYYGIQVNYSDAHWNFSGETSELYGLAWRSTALAAGERFWINPGGGDFDTATNWSPDATPGAADTAVFDLGGTYSVQFSGDVTNQRVRVVNGEVTFELGGYLYSLTENSAIDPSVTIGAVAGDDAHLEFSHGIVEDISAVLGNAADSSGEVVVGSGGAWNHAGELRIGREGAGTLVIEEDGLVSNTIAEIGSEPGSSGQVTVADADCVWQTSGSVFVGGSGSAAGGDGVLQIVGGTVVVGDTLKTWELGAVNMSGGTLHTGTLDLTDGAFAMTSGRLVVDEVVGNLELGGTLAPGDSAGMTMIGGDYTQGAGAELEIEIGGITPISEFDFVDVGGMATLAGTLSVSLLSGFVPAAGNVFEIISAADGVDGMFDVALLPALTGGLLWDVVYSGNSVFLSVEVSGLLGDFNGDGQVDAADYVTWRVGLGSIYTESDLDVWRAQFGQTIGSGSASAAVPEPASLILLLAAAGLACVGLRGRS